MRFEYLILSDFSLVAEALGGLDYRGLEEAGNQTVAFIAIGCDWTCAFGGMEGLPSSRVF